MDKGVVLFSLLLDPGLIHMLSSKQLAQYIKPIFDRCWSIVYDAGPTLGQHWLDISCLLASWVVVSTSAFHARVRSSVPGLGGLKETKNVSSPFTCESQYCGEPP